MQHRDVAHAHTRAMGAPACPRTEMEAHLSDLNSVRHANERATLQPIDARPVEAAASLVLHGRYNTATPSRNHGPAAHGKASWCLLPGGARVIQNCQPHREGASRAHLPRLARVRAPLRTHLILFWPRQGPQDASRAKDSTSQRVSPGFDEA